MRGILLLIFFIVIFGAKAQYGKYPLGARNSGLGGASITISDQWAVFNNVGALGLVTKSTPFASYQNRFNISEFSVMGAGYVHRMEKLVGGIGFYRFGDELFSEQRVNLSIGHQLDRISLGVNVDYLQYNISSIGTKGAVLFEFGGVAEITKSIQFGAHIFNLNQAKLSTREGENLPVVMKAGMSFKPGEELMINFETEKDLDFDEVFRLGVEYRVVENIYARTGFSTSPFTGAAGIGFYPTDFQFDYSFSNDSNLGRIHEISISYLVSK